MSATSIREAVEKVSHVLATQPDKARSKNQPAIASLSEGLKCHVTGPNGEEVRTDMPRGLGGEASAPNPGWLLRAALASCNATCIALRAAKLGIELSQLEVTVSSESDQRGMLGVGVIGFVSATRSAIRECGYCRRPRARPMEAGGRKSGTGLRQR